MMPVGPRVYAGAPVSEEGFYAYLVDLFERINIMGSHVRCERLQVDALFGRACFDRGYVANAFVPNLL